MNTRSDRGAESMATGLHPPARFGSLIAINLGIGHLDEGRFRRDSIWDREERVDGRMSRDRMASDRTETQEPRLIATCPSALLLALLAVLGRAALASRTLLVVVVAAKVARVLKPVRVPTLTVVAPRDSSRNPERGAVVVWVLALVLLTYLAVGVLVDIGSALTTKAATLDTAQQAARAGAGQLDLTTLRRDGRLQLDPAAARTTAEDFLDQAGLTGTVTASTSQVQVTARARKPTVLLRVVGLDSLTLTATATAARSTT